MEDDEGGKWVGGYRREDGRGGRFYPSYLDHLRPINQGKHGGGNDGAEGGFGNVEQDLGQFCQDDSYDQADDHISHGRAHALWREIGGWVGGWVGGRRRREATGTYHVGGKCRSAKVAGDGEDGERTGDEVGNAQGDGLLVDVNLVLELEGVLSGHGEGFHKPNQAQRDGLHKGIRRGVVPQSRQVGGVPPGRDLTHHRNLLACLVQHPGPAGSGHHHDDGREGHQVGEDLRRR